MNEVYRTNPNQDVFLPSFSWSSSLAGALIALITYIAFMLLGGALGLSIMSFEGGINLSAASWGTGIFWILFSSIAIAFGAYIAGRLSQNVSGYAGAMNGLLVWALLSVVNISFTTSTVAKMASAAGDVIESGAGAVESSLAGLSRVDLEANIGAMLGIENMEQLGDKVEQIKAPEVKAVVAKEYNSVKKDLQSTAMAILKNPDARNTEIKELKSSIRASLDNIDKELSSENIKEIVANNSELSNAEVNQIASEWRGELNEVMTSVDRNLAQLEQKAEEFKENAQVEADKAADKIAASMGILFVLFLVGFVISIIFGRMGARSARIAVA